MSCHSQIYQQIIRNNLKTACLDFSKTNSINFCYMAGDTFGKVVQSDWVLFCPESYYLDRYSGQYALQQTR